MKKNRSWPWKERVLAAVILIILVVLLSVYWGDVQRISRHHHHSGKSMSHDYLGKGVETSESRTLSSRVTNIFSDATIDLVVQQGATPSILVEAPSDVIAMILTRVDELTNTLKISMDPNSNIIIPENKKLKITVTLPSLTRLDMNGVGDCTVGGFNNKDISVNMTGTGDVILTGSSTKIELMHNGVGTIDATKWQAQDVSVMFTGVGDVKAYASRSISGTLQGVGSVIISGNPSVRNISSNSITATLVYA